MDTTELPITVTETERKIDKALGVLMDAYGFQGESGTERMFWVLHEAVKDVAHNWNVVEESHEDGLSYNVNAMLSSAIYKILSAREDSDASGDLAVTNAAAAPDDAPNDDNAAVLALADRLVNEVGAFLDANQMSSTDIADAIGGLICVGTDLLDCAGCRRQYIEALKAHIAHLDEAELSAVEHVH